MLSEKKCAFRLLTCETSTDMHVLVFVWSLDVHIGKSVLRPDRRRSKAFCSLELRSTQQTLILIQNPWLTWFAFAPLGVSCYGGEKYYALWYFGWVFFSVSAYYLLCLFIDMWKYVVFQLDKYLLVVINPNVNVVCSFTDILSLLFQIEHSMAKLSTGAAPQDSHVVDVSGPLLPHHTLNICAVMQQAGAEPSIITFNTHEHSAPLNLSVGLLPGSSVSAKPQAVSTVNMAGSGSWEPGHPGRGECKENAAVTVNRNENSSSGGFANNNSAAARGTDSACPTWNRSVVRGLRRQRCLSEGTSRPCGGEDSMDSTGGGDSGLMGRLPSHVGTKQAEKCCWGLHSWRNGLHNTVQGQLCAVSGLETGAILREVTCFPDKFEWSCWCSLFFSLNQLLPHCVSLIIFINIFILCESEIYIDISTNTLCIENICMC